MKRLSMYVCTIVFACTVTVMLTAMASYHSHFVGSAVSNSGDAAFRDGLFLGQRDVERGRKPHISSGRWNADSDRRSFISGYLHAYRQMYDRADSQSHRVWSLAEQRGFSDGIIDGLQQRRGSKAFHLNGTENYKTANRGSSNTDDLIRYKKLYREAYCNGYQVGYYGEHKKTNKNSATYARSLIRAVFI